MSAITAKSIPVGSSIQGIAVNPNTGLVYAADYNKNVVYVLDPSNGYAPPYITIPVGLQPQSVAVDFRNNLIYTANQNISGPPNLLGTLSIIDGASHTVTGTVDLPDIPIQVVVNQATGDVFTGGGNVTRISQGVVAKTIVIGSAAVTGLCVSALDTVAFLYLGPQFRFWLARVKADTLAYIDQTIVVPLNANGINANIDAKTIYTTSLQASVVQAWDASDSPPVVAVTTPTGGYPERVAVNVSNQNYYTCNYWNSNVTLVDPSSGTPVTIDLGHQPWDIDVNPQTNVVYTANWDGTVSYF